MARFALPGPRWGAALLSVALAAGAMGVPPATRAAGTIHVPGDYPTIQAAIDAASPGATVVVDAGTYAERITIGKDIVVESASGPGATTIDGGTGGTTVQITAGTGEHPTLRGFTVTNGYNGSGAGGIAVSDGPALVEDNVVTGNFGCFGGGIGAGGSQATIRDNVIEDNRLACSGGDAAGVSIGGAGTVKLIGNTISNNAGTGVGMNAAGTPTIDSNVIASNAGSGIQMGNSSDALITNNLIRDNATGGIAALVPLGARGPYIINNTLVGNATSLGNSIFAEGFDASSKIVNNVIVAATASAAVECTLSYDPAPPIVAYNDVHNTVGPAFGDACAGLTGVSGNVSVDPGFVDASRLDFHLRPDSPLLDAGTNTDAPATDVDGDARPFDSDWNGSATADPGFDEMTDPVLVDPPVVDFGSVGQGLLATPSPVSVTNFGAVPLSIGEVSLGGSEASDFKITSETCTAGPIATSATCTVTVGFAPGALGPRSATLTLTGGAPVGSRVVTLSGTGIRAPSGVGWSATRRAGPAYTWNYGGSLARTVQSGTNRLHLAYATDRIGSSWAKDSGPYAGIYYTRSTSGATWTTPKRVNPSRQHATIVGLAASGSRVYVMWASQTKYIRYSPTAPRVLYVRVNRSHGASDKWKSAVRLTSSTGRVDYPTIAASGSDAYIAWTDSDTGVIRVAASHDRGDTWKKVAVGSTTAATSNGWTGEAAVAASGSTVAVVWTSDAAGTLQGVVSTDRGAHWDAAATIGTGSTSVASVAVRGARVAVAWAAGGDIVLRQRESGTWSDAVSVTSNDPGDSNDSYAPTVLLQDPQRVAVAWSHVSNPSSYWTTLNWVESADGGATWFAEQVLATTSTSARRANDWASVAWPTASTRHVVWNGWTTNTSRYRLYLRTGSGTPVGPSTAAEPWNPRPTAAPTHPADPRGNRANRGVR